MSRSKRIYRTHALFMPEVLRLYARELYKNQKREKSN